MVSRLASAGWIKFSAMRALILACGVAAATVGHGQEVRIRPEHVVVTGVGSDADAMSEACSGFFLTAKEAGACFESAKIIDAFEEHDH